ncbi:MAG: TonB-dependent receptor [Sphingomonadales bacterium]|nr:TonB-dependent receptor [Sphingomonadales bacterium]
MTFTGTISRNLRNGIALGGMAAALLAGVPALAAAAPEPQAKADNGQLDEIVVTAQHREENLRAVPIAVNAVNADTLKNIGVSDTSNLVQAVPSLNFTRSGPSGIFVIRGVATPNGAAGEEGSTAVYVDDVYMPDLASTVNNFNNIQRVEVLNGPQGTLFGRNAAGGLIRIITRDPGQQTVFNGQMGYGNYQTFDGQAYAATPLSDKAAIDIAFTGHDQGKGFGYDVTQGKDVRTDRHWGVRSKLVLHATDSIKVTLGGDYYKTDDTTPVYIFPISITPATGVANGPISGQDSPAGYPSGTHIRAWGISGKIEADVGFADLTSISAYRKLKNHSDFDVDGSATDLFHLGYDSGTRSFQQELRLNSKGSGPLQWQLGGFYFHAFAFTDQFQDGLALRGTRSHIFAHGKTDSLSVFGEATYALTPTTHLTGGLRYTSDKRKLPEGYVDTILAATGAVLAHKTNTLTEKTFNQVTFRAALRQDITDNVNVYLSVNKGFKAGEFNLQVPGDAPVNPETIMAYEGGLKGDFLNRHLRISLAGFHYDIKNYQIRTTVGTITALQNATSVKVDGVDITAEAAVNSQLHLNVGASWLNSRFGQFGGAGTNVTAPGYYPASDPGNATGHMTALAPHFTLNLGATYTIPLPEGREIRLTGNMTHKSSYVFEADNVLRQPAYTVANGSIELKLTEHVSIEGWMRNIGNKNYNVQMVTSVGQAALAAAPRQYGMDFKWNF